MSYFRKWLDANRPKEGFVLIVIHPGGRATLSFARRASNSEPDDLRPRETATPNGLRTVLVEAPLYGLDIFVALHPGVAWDPIER